MPPFFSNKRLIILMTSLIVLVALVGFSMKERKQMTWPEQFVHDTVGFFQFTFSKPARYVAGFFENVREIQDVYDENKILKSHLQEYASLNSKYTNLQEQYNQLKKQLNMSGPALTDSKKHVAFVIGRSFDQWNQQLTVDKGLKQGIKIGMAVETADGFIGKVTAVSQFTSVVTLVTDPSNANQISAMVVKKGNNNINGMIEGYDDKQNVLLFKKIPIDANITKGDMVISSGLGQVYPMGLYIGKVEKVVPDQYGLTKTAEVKPAADFNNIEVVDIIERLAPTASGGYTGP